jgi:DNA-binding NtrC family response regulator
VIPNILIEKSKKYKRISKEIISISASKCDVLIIGEPGTGKGVIAKKIYEETGRFDNELPYTRVKLSHMKEKELSDILCKLENNPQETVELVSPYISMQSKVATIVIEEVETAGYQNQKRLISFLNRLTCLRSLYNDHMINIRVIITVREAPSLLVDKNEITVELAQYLESFTRIFIPPLRENREDILHLVEHFITETCRKIGIQEPVLDINTISILLEHPWKNNIRELKSVIGRSILFSSCGTFTLPRDFVDKEMKVTRLLETMLDGKGKTIDGSLDTIERNVIDSALKKFKINILKTAEYLGMSQEHLEFRATQLGLIQKNNYGG